MSFPMGSAQHAVEIALSFEGYREGAGNSNRFSRDLGRPAEAWCADFVEDVLRLDGVKPVIKSAYCPTVEAAYKRAGRLFTTPQVGDQGFVFSPSQGVVIHTFMVVQILNGGRSVRTIEGNTNTDGSSNGIGVFRRIRSVLRPPGGAGVRSYGRPLWTPQAPVARITKPATLQASVPALQRAVHLKADGLWGPKTDRALALLRGFARTGRVSASATRELQSYVGASPDGKVGPLTRAAAGRSIRAVQAAFRVAPDGDWGPITDAAYVAARNRFHH